MKKKCFLLGLLVASVVYSIIYFVTHYHSERSSPLCGKDKEMSKLSENSSDIQYHLAINPDISAWLEAKSAKDMFDIKQKYVNERLNLSPDVSKKFWMLYDVYLASLNQCLESTKKIMETTICDSIIPKEELLRVYHPENLSNEDALKIIANKNRMAELEIKFSKDLQNILEPHQIITFYQAEIDIRRLLLKELKNTYPEKINIQ